MNSKLVIWISFISATLSISAICLVLFRCEPLEADWVAIEVTVLSMLVTILIGWQIWNVLKIDERIREDRKSFDEKMKDVSKEFDEKMIKIANDINHIAIANEYKWESLNMISDPDDPAKSVEFWLKALEEVSKTETPGVNQSTISAILERAKEYIDYFDQEGKVLSLTKAKKEEYISMAKRVSNDEVVDLIMYISKAITPESSVDIPKG